MRPRGDAPQEFSPIHRGAVELIAGPNRLDDGPLALQALHSAGSNQPVERFPDHGPADAVLCPQYRLRRGHLAHLPDASVYGVAEDLVKLLVVRYRAVSVDCATGRELGSIGLGG